MLIESIDEAKEGAAEIAGCRARGNAPISLRWSDDRRTTRATNIPQLYMCCSGSATRDGLA